MEAVVSAKSDATTITLEADAQVELLGFSPKRVTYAAGMPPNSLVVGELADQGWAARNGVSVGDILSAIGTFTVTELTKMEILEHLMQRPVRLTFLRPAKTEADVDAEIQDSLDKITTAKQALHDASREASALETVLQYENFSPGGKTFRRGSNAGLLPKNAREALAALAGVADMDMLETGGDLDAFWEDDGAQEVMGPSGSVISYPGRRRSSVKCVHLPDADGEDEDDTDPAWPVKEDLPYTVEIKEGVKHLGFACFGEPPDMMSVARVDPEGWAARQGLEEEDVLLLVGDRLTTEISSEDFKNLLRRRPLKLTFLREHDEGLPPPDPHQVIEAVQMLGRAMTNLEAEPLSS